MMHLLNWHGIEQNSLRDVIESMQRLGLLGEALGRLFALPKEQDEFDEGLVTEVMGEAASVVRSLGDRALQLLDAQAAPKTSTLTDISRKRTTTPRAVRLCTQLAGVEKEGG